MPKRSLAFAFQPILALWLVALFGVDAAAEVTGKRLALVIGNSAYTGDLAALRNPVNDARLMEKTLRQVGFSVTRIENADWQVLTDAIVTFGDALHRGGKDGVGLFYYAGHGVQYQGENYLIPVGARVEYERHLKARAVSAKRPLEEMEGAPTALNIVVLDACRNNPFAAGRSFGKSRGLVRMDVPTGSFFVAYSAAAGQVAEDGDGANSVYTAALAAAMAQPGLQLEDVFKRAGHEVETQTGGSQKPWQEGSWYGAFHFVSPPRVGVAPVREPGMDPEEEEWRFVRDSGNPERVRDFLERHPNGRFSGAAQALIEQLSGARFTVETEPPGAGVRLVGHDYQAGMRLPAGLYRVEVTADGHETRTVTVSHGGSPTTQRVVLRKVADCPTCQPFTVRTGPPDARVQIMNIGPRYEPGIKLPPGSYDVRVTARGFDTVERSLRHDDEPTDKWIGLPFRDCPVCPKMVELPKGSYTMGTSKEEDISTLGKERDSSEGPAHKVEIRYPLAVGVFEVSFEEWDACVEDAGCVRHLRDEGRGRGRRPVVHATLADAKEYANWLTARIGRHYRLLSEAEWEYAARAGTSSGRHWGGRLEDQCAYENGADVTAQGENSDWTIVNCIDGYVYAAPTDETRFRSNPWGLHHMLGNVSEWTADCWHPNYVGAPTDGSAWTGDCDNALHVVRGGSWLSVPRGVRAPTRLPVDPAESSNDVGFRVAVEVTR